MPDDYRIRVATPEDAAAVGELLAACYPVLMRDSYEPAVLAAALPMMTRAHPGLLASGTYHVAEAPDGRLVGCGGWTPERPDIGAIEPGVAHIRHFATHPDWIGRGVGRAICDRCISEARNFGASRLECFSSLNA
jgi:GNAT superfamily N-acetyltransferase